MPVTRRSFLNAAPLAMAPVLWPSPRDWQTNKVDVIFPTQPPELAQEMVGASHNNLARVKELLAIHPTLARAAWDWGFGDWEDALGAASHVGNRDIAAVLLAHGARPTIFSAAMLGHLEVVKAFIAASPGIESTPGPHGITLLSHANAGGAGSAAVAEHLKTLPGANKRPDTQAISPEQLKALVGSYVFGPGPGERVAIALTANNVLTFMRDGRSARNLTHTGDLTFFPTGAPLVRVRFAAAVDGMVMTVHDPDLVITARRSS